MKTFKQALKLINGIHKKMNAQKTSPPRKIKQPKPEPQRCPICNYKEFYMFCENCECSKGEFGEIIVSSEHIQILRELYKNRNLKGKL